MFQIIKRNRTTKARLGILKTPHGIVKTPAYVIVATKGEIKTLKPSDVKKTKTQIVIANTYHLWDKILNSKSEVLNKTRKSKIPNPKPETFLIKQLGTKLPTMTDSGGFQVFSLAFGRHAKAGKIFPRGTTETRKKPENTEETKRQNIKITDGGVYFKTQSHDIARRDFGRQWQFMEPELSMEIQQKLGADIIFAFDECTSFFDDFKYNKKAMERTHAWALKCLKCQRSNVKGQMLFGIVQGGRYKSLRVQSAKFIGSLPFDGFGIGGSFGKEEMVKMLNWVIPHLPEEKPRHLLGIGRIEDIFRAVENGIDLFDCVIPTREARHGRIWTTKGHYDIRKSVNKNKKSPLEQGCKCPTCKTTTKAQLYFLFKNPTTLSAAQRLATIHNVYFFNNLIEQIRDSIAKDKFTEFKNKFLKNL